MSLLIPRHYHYSLRIVVFQYFYNNKQIYQQQQNFTTLILIGRTICEQENTMYCKKANAIQRLNYRIYQYSNTFGGLLLYMGFFLLLTSFKRKRFYV